jgi:hypothetical protein
MNKSVEKHRIFAVIAVALALVLNTACSGDKTTLNYHYNTGTGAALPYPDVSFAVISDAHVYDPSLGSTGSAFEKTMNSDR